MSELNNIDELFKAKLAGRVVAGGESAWAGAASLLDQHYRLIALKRFAAAVFSVFALIGVVSTLAYIGIDSEQPFYTQTQPEATEAPAAAYQESVSVSTIEAESVQESTTPQESTSEVANLEAEHSYSEESFIEETNQASAESRLVANDNALAVEPPMEQTPGLTAIPSADYNQEASAPEVAFEEMEEVESVSLFQGMPIFKLESLGSSLLSEATLENRNEHMEPLINALKKVEVGISAGVMGVNGFENNQSAKEPAGLGGYASVYGRYYFNSRLFGQTGATLHARGNLASVAPTQTTPTEIIATRTTSVAYLDIPIEVGYRFGARHSVTFGLAYAPLITSRYQTESTDVLSSGDADNTQIVGRGFSKTGFANFDVAGLIGYQIQLTNRLDGTLGLRYGLFDITDNNHFGTGVIDDRNHQVKVGINYRLINR